MSKTIIVIIVLAVALGGIYLLRNESSQNADQTASVGNTTSGNEVVVTYTDSGYSPKQITIKAGTAVKFLNQGQNPMWTASDPHPTHTMMHDFDAMRAIMLGDSYSFTFTRPGTWRYHNHMVPGHMGRVMVE